jgi:hypothetical protein
VLFDVDVLLLLLVELIAYGKILWHAHNKETFFFFPDFFGWHSQIWNKSLRANEIWVITIVNDKNVAHRIFYILIGFRQYIVNIFS